MSTQRPSTSNVAELPPDVIFDLPFSPPTEELFDAALSPGTREVVALITKDIEKEEGMLRKRRNTEPLEGGTAAKRLKLEELISEAEWIALRDLEPNILHEVDRFEFAAARNVQKVCVVLANQTRFYLPDRYNRKFSTAEHLDVLNSGKLSVQYKGKRVLSSDPSKTFHDIRFIQH